MCSRFSRFLWAGASEWTEKLIINRKLRLKFLHDFARKLGFKCYMTTPAAADVLDRGRKDGILARCIASRSCPKIIHIDSDWEQWQQAGSLVVSDALGQPIELPERCVLLWSRARRMRACRREPGSVSLRVT